MGFKDRFSEQAGEYARFRPGYPEALFKYLAGLPHSRARAWDCGTGNGQAAVGLARYFEEVIATDRSRQQIAQAIPHPRVSYRVCEAGSATLETGSVDLIVVAQALHWFNLEQFYHQVSRVGRRGSILAVWCYGLPSVNLQVDGILREFYRGTVGPYWDPERRLVDCEYATIAMPFAQLPVGSFMIRNDWELKHFLGYLATWSAVRRYIRQNRRDPVGDIALALRDAWGEPGSSARITWSIHLRIGRVNAG